MPHCLPTDCATPTTYTLSLHDALPIFARALYEAARGRGAQAFVDAEELERLRGRVAFVRQHLPEAAPPEVGDGELRSEEHTSELQSRFDLVCRLLLEKKKKNNSILG